MAGFSFRFSFLYVVFLGLFLLVVSTEEDVAGGRGRELVPALFIFGDSLIDNGNNNNLPSLARADYYPYGIDFPAGPTGRFSNGYTIVDEIGQYYCSIYIFYYYYYFHACSSCVIRKSFGDYNIFTRIYQKKKKNIFSRNHVLGSCEL